jgi:hypothetical protein
MRSSDREEAEPRAWRSTLDLDSMVGSSKTTMSNMAMNIVTCGDHHVAIWLHTAEDPSPALWTAGVQRVAELKRTLGGDVSKILTMAISDGGAPNTLQRGQLFTDVLEGKARVAGVSSQLSNRLVRGITTAIFWLNPSFRAYPPTEFDKALSHLDISAYREQLLAAFQQLQLSINRVETLVLAQQVKPT